MNGFFIFLSPAFKAMWNFGGVALLYSISLLSK